MAAVTAMPNDAGVGEEAHHEYRHGRTNKEIGDATAKATPGAVAARSRR